MRKWEKVLFGPEGEVSALERGKADGFIATVSSNPVAIFDNVDEKIAWLPDHLAQVATGITIRRRRLYTTNQEVSYLPNCWIGLTSRTPDFLNGREDVLDRTLVFRTARLKENTPEHHLLEEVQTNRNQIWSELLKCLNRIVAYYRSGPKSAGKMNYRMADFAEFAVALGRLEHREEIAHRVLGKLECAQTEMLFEQDPILDCLCEWLKTGKNRGREVTAAELSGDLGRIADMCSLPWPYSGARSLGQRLPHILRNLKERFELEQRKDSAGQWHYKFWPKSGTLNHPERPSPLLPDVQSTVEQGDPNLSLNH